jgi:SAM-dependent methyltransferase
MIATALLRRTRRSLTQRLNRVLPTRGINIGGGSWLRLGWYNLDQLHSVDDRSVLDARTRLPFSDESIALVFSSHFFEHVTDETAENLFRETRRVLRPGGIFRIAVPDFELVIERYLAGDHAFFDGGDIDAAVRYENWRGHNVPVTLENKLSFLFCSYGNKDPHGRWPAWKFDPSYYCGPVAADPSRIRAFAVARDVGGLSRYLLALAPKDAYDYGHINWWTETRFRELLGAAGVHTITRSRYRRSRTRELRGPAFDNRPGWTLYIEAIK